MIPIISMIGVENQQTDLVHPRPEDDDSDDQSFDRALS